VAYGLSVAHQNVATSNAITSSPRRAAAHPLMMVTSPSVIALPARESVTFPLPLYQNTTAQMTELLNTMVRLS